ncbi:GNAT family N-acetyltransferase [Sphingomonas sp.]|uniref:GNAT family N-acetyltransferase n=1 Tax=Sphingomonas sp. TaxID=28214 RepID=UPI003CC5E656
MIQTERLLLRPFRPDDADAFARVLNTPAMMAHLGGMKSRAAIDASLGKRLADQARDGFSYWAVELRDGSALVGTCGLRLGQNYPGTPVEGLHELGWRIAEAHWRTGLAREAAEATIAWTWANTAAPLLAAWTTAANVASWRLMERLGMARRRDLDFTEVGCDPADLLGARMVYALDRPA